MISNELVKELRERSGISVMECKWALEEANGDIDGAVGILDRKFGGMASQKSSRELNAGIVDSYIHSNGKIGVLLSLHSETDFVSRNPAFRELAHEISLHIAAMNPRFRSIEDIPADVAQQYETDIRNEVAKLDKSKDIADQIVEGKLESQLGEIALLSQPFVKDPTKTVRNLVEEAVGKFGENIQVGKFVRYQI